MLSRICTYFYIGHYPNTYLFSCSWEQFRADTGKGAGNARFSGFVTPVLSMYRAHRIYGSVETGYETLVHPLKLAVDEVELSIESPFFTGTTGLSIVLEANTDYRFQDRIIRSDEYGWLGLEFFCRAGEKQSLVIKAVTNPESADTTSDHRCRVVIS